MTGLDHPCHDSIEITRISLLLILVLPTRGRRTHSNMAFDTSAADEFQLFDLRVEVVCPPGKRIMCGAKEGDYFMLQGEMLYLPPDQGISIYSLCKSSNSVSCSPANSIQP